MHLLTAKLLSLAAIAAVSMLFGMLPCYLVRWFNSRGVLRTPRVRVFISAVICFSGGTLLGVAFLHLMPDMRDKMQGLGWEGHWQRLPISDIVTCGGFFFVYIFDELMHMFIEWYSGRAERRRHRRQAGGCGGAQRPPSPAADGGADSEAAEEAADPDPCAATAPLHHEVHIHGRSSARRLDQRPLGFHEHEHDPHSSSHPIDAPAAVPPLTGLITIVALSFHDIFEGLAIGVESEARDVLFLYLSIAAHKYAIAFCIGMDLVLSGTRPLHLLLYMLTFSAVSPVGIIVGIVAVQGQQPRGLAIDTPVTVLLQGLAGGTLIYVVCFEVLQREGSATHAKGVCNVLFVLLGFLLTLAFKYTLGHSHTLEAAAGGGRSSPAGR